MKRGLDLNREYLRARASTCAPGHTMERTGWVSRFVGSSDGWRLASRVCYLLSVAKKSRRARTLGQGIRGTDGADESLMAKGILQEAAPSTAPPAIQTTACSGCGWRRDWAAAKGCSRHAVFGWRDFCLTVEVPRVCGPLCRRTGAFRERNHRPAKLRLLSAH